MAISPEWSPQAAIVDRLRLAGCVFAEDEARLLSAAARTPAQLADLLDQRIAGRPLEHVIGWVEFCGLRISVDPGVFVPRRRTEFLVHQAVAARHRETGPGSLVQTVVVDLCCGSGAVGVALLAAFDRAELHAVDIDPTAVRCARRNIATNGTVYEGDLCHSLPPTLRGRVDVLVANGPYVPTDAIGLMPREARLYEPQVALDGGADGLDVLRRVVLVAPRWLSPGGHLLTETSESQAPRIAALMARTGLVPKVVSSKELGATVVIATTPSSRVDHYVY